MPLRVGSSGASSAHFKEHMFQCKRGRALLEPEGRPHLIFLPPREDDVTFGEKPLNFFRELTVEPAQLQRNYTERYE